MIHQRPTSEAAADDRLKTLGQQIRAWRKALRISATAAAEAARMSRMTLHRIERGEPSVTMGAYLNVVTALGLDLAIVGPAEAGSETQNGHRTGWIPARIRIADYPQLKSLAWQLKGAVELTPEEALAIYERNSRHLDLQTMGTEERELLDALRLALGRRGHV
jgi:transcriptional regulator with XRE-family HTH domain